MPFNRGSVMAVRFLKLSRFEACKALLCFHFVLVFALVISLGLSALAQVPPGVSDTDKSSTEATALPDDLSEGEVRDLVSRLSDEDVRTLLIQQLDKVADANQEAAAAEQTTDAMLVAAQWRLQTAIDAIPSALNLGSTIVGKFREHGDDSLVYVILFAFVGFGVGFAADAVFRRLFPRPTFGHAADQTIDTTAKLSLLGLNFLRDVLSIGIFALAAAAGFFLLWQGNEAVRALTASIWWVILLTRSVAAVSRFFLAPGELRPARLTEFSDTLALALHRRLLIVAGATILALQFGNFLNRIGVTDPGTLLLIDALVSFLALAVIVVMAWYDRKAVREALLKQDADQDEPPGRLQRFVADTWHIMLTAFLIIVCVLHLGQRLLTGADDPAPIMITLILMLALPAVALTLNRALGSLLKIRESHANLVAAEERESEARAALAAIPAPDPYVEDDEASEALARRRAVLSDEAQNASAARVQAQRTLNNRRDIHRVLVRNLRVVLFVLFAAAVVNVWDLDLQSFASAGLGEVIASSLVDIIAVLIIASAAWGIVNAVIRNATPPEPDEDSGESEIGGKGGTRLQTLVPLFGRFLLIVIAVMVTLIILSELGVDIGPLIAGAGVIGIAVGFGAQTLVRDILSGLFFLIDDAFRVGEYIDVGKVRGMVEHISVRSLRLRHHLGPLHTIPFGEIGHLTNFSRDWAIMKLEFRIPFDTDLEKVRKLVKKTGQDMMNHPDYGKNFLQPVKSQGVHRMDDDAFIVRVKFMTKPGEQFVIRREVYRRIQEAFAANGINVAPRRVIVDTGEAPTLTPAALAAAAGGAGVLDRDRRGEDLSGRDDGHDM